MKHAFKSKTIWGAIITLIASSIIYLKSNSPETDYFALVNMLGAVFSIIGRIYAKEEIYFLKKKHKENKEC